MAERAERLPSAAPGGLWRAGPPSTVTQGHGQESPPPPLADGSAQAAILTHTLVAAPGPSPGVVHTEPQKAQVSPRPSGLQWEPTSPPEPPFSLQILLKTSIWGNPYVTATRGGDQSQRFPPRGVVAARGRPCGWGTTDTSTVRDILGVKGISPATPRSDENASVKHREEAAPKAETSSEDDWLSKKMRERRMTPALLSLSNRQPEVQIQL